MEQNLSLTPAQIQYLKIGPKVGTSSTTTKQLQESISRFDVDGNNASTSLSGIPKFSYGNFEQTVNNFGVLLHRNFVGTTSLHQAQKFGKVACSIDASMLEEKDKPVDERRTGHRKSFVDARSCLKAIYEHQGHRLLVTLKSFVIETEQTKRTVETLPLAYVTLMINHVSSSKLAKSIESAMRSEGSSMVTIDYERMESKVTGSHNMEEKYGEGPFILERSGQSFNIVPPVVEIYHSESEYKTCCRIDNKDILDILESDFENVDRIVEKYFDVMDFDEHLRNTKPQSHRDVHRQEPKPIQRHSESREEVSYSEEEAPKQPELSQTPRPVTPKQSQSQRPQTPQEIEKSLTPKEVEAQRPQTPQQAEKPLTPKQNQPQRPQTPQQAERSSTPQQAERPSTPKEAQPERPQTPKQAQILYTPQEPETTSAAQPEQTK